MVLAFPGWGPEKAVLGGIFWYWPFLGGDPGRPRAGVLGGIFWYWPFSAGLDVLSACFWLGFCEFTRGAGIFLGGREGEGSLGEGGHRPRRLPVAPHENRAACASGAAAATPAAASVLAVSWREPAHARLETATLLLP